MCYLQWYLFRFFSRPLLNGVINSFWRSGLNNSRRHFFDGIASGIDHADLLEVRAPKPALMITTTRDFFSIQGARETANEVAGVYKIFNKEKNF